jgi:hypothetical protein
MGRLISPAEEEIPNLKTPPTAGELRVMQFFKSGLDDAWEIYFQPHLNGCRPDFVLLNPDVGIGVFEVKDWDLKAQNLNYSFGKDGHRTLTGEHSGVTSKRRDPLQQIQSYKYEISDLYCPRLNSLNIHSVITAGLIFPFAEDDELNELFGPVRIPQGGDEVIVGRSALESSDVLRIFPNALREKSSYMSEDHASDLRGWLIEPDYSAEQRQPLELSADQSELVETRTDSGYRRIRGAAGSGKSVVLASRAAKLAHDGKAVLVVSYNITLLHYLRDLVARCPNGKPNTITWLNFHQWCKRVADDLDIEEYSRVWRDHFSGSDRYGYDPDEVLRKHIPNLVGSELAQREVPETRTFDAIIVDEGQDFYPNWWSALREVCNPGGELLLAADESQDVYGSASSWTDEAMTGAGFTGRWSELKASYRLPLKLLPLAGLFARDYLSDKPHIFPSPPGKQSELDLAPCALRWVQTTRDRAAETSFGELLRLISEDENRELAFADLTYLSDDRAIGATVVDLLSAKLIKTVHTFDKNDTREERRKKLAFWKGDARVKATTIHCFKGWEARTIVLNITRAGSSRDLASVYTGITRVKKHPQGSWLTVVCSDNRLERFGRMWPDFVKN